MKYKSNCCLVCRCDNGKSITFNKNDVIDDRIIELWKANDELDFRIKEGHVSNLEAENKTKLEAENKTKLEAENKTKLEAENKTKLEAENKTKQHGK